MAFESNYTFALAAIVFAAILDAIDGRLARFLKGTSRFGAELDSLADFVNFGVAPALIIYFWGLHDLKSAGWIAAMVFAICVGLRLARFNVMLDDPDRPAWANNFFVGMPAPAGAITVLLPIYASFLGLPARALADLADADLHAGHRFADGVAAAGFFRQAHRHAGAARHGRAAHSCCCPLLCHSFAYPWELLTVGTLAYLASLPFGWLSYREYERRSRQNRAEAAPAAAQSPPLAAGLVQPPDGEDRPSRLN